MMPKGKRVKCSAVGLTFIRERLRTIAKKHNIMSDVILKDGLFITTLGPVLITKDFMIIMSHLMDGTFHILGK